MTAPFAVVTIGADELAALVKKAVREAMAGAGAGGAIPADRMTPGEVAGGFRVRRATVQLALATGALPSLRRPAAGGRTPRDLISRPDAEAWVRAGCPVDPGKTA